ncbi:MAG TPA: hypothetical protein VKK81_17855 [Candidatus Binatia bacterium]|nr:hypothetical protein [Candidatus Binatia bacterium]
MRTRLTLPSGQDDVKQMLAEQGDRLVWVRHRYDERRQKRFKTVELIVEESDWPPHTSQRAAESVVALRIARSEV